MRLLLVEDEIHLSQALAELLKKNKFLVDVVYDGVSAYEFSKNQIYDAIILDIMLPKMNGIDVLKSIRNDHNNVPVILLTAKEDLNDKIVGLDSGADDYITKPFSKDELLARIRAVLRRKGEIIDRVLLFNDIKLNLDTDELICVLQDGSENSIKLALKEFHIMELLLQNPKQIITKERLIEKIWGGDSDAEYNNVEVYISFLRKKLKFLNSKTEISTTRGLGYSLA